jgi:hypothetical protein
MMIDMSNKIVYKYNEDQIIADFKAYIDRTYGEHYKAEDLETFDVWEAMGTASTTCRDTAIKYLMRYGKKNGKNKDDLMKTLHYVLLCLHIEHYKNKVNT